MGEARIELVNIADGHVVQHPLLLLEGKFICDWDLPDNVLAEVHVNDTATSWPVSHSGAFKVLVPLPTYGRHEICLNIAETYEIVSVEYAPSTRQNRVHVYYQKGQGSTGSFHAPPGVDNSEAVAVKKIKFNAALLQTAMAALLGAPYTETFSLEVDDDGQPIVHVLESSFTDDVAKSISEHELIGRVEEDLRAQGFMDDDLGKHVVLLGSSTFDTATKTPRGHTALGNSAVGVFGSCGLHTWASHVGNVMQSFLDTTRIDPASLWDDSAGRGTYAANYSTGLGAVLHELGHAFGLSHTTHGIMARGFDDLNRLFCVVQPRPDPTSSVPAFSNAFPDGKLFLNYARVEDVVTAEGAHWHRASALKLRLSPWLSSQTTSGLCGTQTVPAVAWGKTIVGPVGCGAGPQIPFGTDSKDVAAFLITSGASTGVTAIEILTNASLNDLLFCGLAASGSQDLFILMDGEYIVQVDVRAKAWVDAIRFHTNFRVSRFFGGKGGNLHVLKAPPNHILYSFFGTTGQNVVGALGAYATLAPRGLLMNQNHLTPPAAPVTTTPLPSPPLTSIFDQIGSFFGASESTPPRPTSATSGAYATIGTGAEGEQDAFTTKNITSIGAILLVCADEAIISFRVLSRKEYSEVFGEGYYAAPNELAFVLAAHEVIIQVDVRSSGWIHGLRFHTNVRMSPWYGGTDGEEHSFVCAPESHITAFYGSHGPQYLGTLGTYFGPLPHHLPRPQPLPNLAPLPCLHGGAGVDIVRIRASASGLEFTSSALAVDEPCTHVFPLQKGEVLVQVEVVRANGQIIGAAFHTQTRSSKWYGQVDGLYEIVVAPPSLAFASICTSRGEVQHTFESEDVCRVEDVSDDDGTSEADLGQEKALHAVSDVGIAYVVLHQFNNGDPLADHVVEFAEPSALPQSWRISATYLKAKVHPRPLTDYAVEVVDATGTSTLSPVLAPCLP
ncbi:hypothetical protein H310_07167 [Aphanomyces invadans]|uniref:Jacalin-type lectin domain-containing protein n=1 Tax=Aphanomyces invadans TaxID=157072 RepID=A0A024U4Q0_9STRA|nr:hypothetical protein H310_07167 [Aphanomyces invadans]ETW00593.1 hypothetical protein H310_07167 [Aphanomyces invadans]|eukprot:XP_008870728.1 hypothetical protein H310_07167 [Aphanomyces invadans]